MRRRSANLGTVAGATVTAVLVVALAACGGGSSDSHASTSTSAKAGSGGASALTGVTWLLSDTTDLGTPTTGITVTAEFADGSMTGTGGCNNYSTTYRASGSSLRLAPVAATQMACPPPASTVETAYLAKLPDVRSFAVAGKVLTLSGADGTALLVYDAADGAQQLQGKWDTTSYYNVAAIVSATEPVPTAEFDGGTVQGTNGCNGYSAPYTVSATSISIGPFGPSTLMACGDAIDKQATDFQAALLLAKTFRVTGDKLTLFRDGGTIAATFVRATG